MVLSMERWIGKVAIVTGASSGIGAAIAEALVEHGVKVVGLARRLDKLESFAEKLSEKKGKLYPLKTDISKEEDILNAFKWIKDNLGPVYILINNAGIDRAASLSEGNAEDWKDILNVNVIGLSIATREAVKDMKSNKVDGHVIHINSVVGHYIPAVLTGIGMYAASKYAVTALTELLRLEFNADNIRIKITSISPGLVNTEIISPESREGFFQETIARNQILDPEDIADGVVYALSTPPHVQVHELTIKPIGEKF